MSPNTQNESQPSATTKMRSSCNACADAKIACSKGKPACDRCVRRQEPCIYVPTRRAGRPALNKQNQKRKANTGNTRSTAAVDTTAPSTASSDNVTVQWPTGNGTDNAVTSAPIDTPIMTDATIDIDAYYLPDWITATGIDDSVSSASPLSSSLAQQSGAPYVPAILDPDDATFPTDFFMFDKSQTQGNGDVSIFDTAKGLAYLNGDHGTRPDPLFHDGALSNPMPPLPEPITGPRTKRPSSQATNWFSSGHSRTDSLASSTASTLPSESGSPQTLPLADPDISCECLARSLSLMRQLSPLHGRCSNPHRSPTSAATLQPTFESIMSQNRTTITILNKILNCKCSNDPSLLSILAMVVFKTLGWFAACACAVRCQKDAEQGDDGLPFDQAGLSVQPPAPATMSGYDFDDGDQDRVIGPLVLSELYGVRRTVNVLSERLQAWEKTSRRLSSSHGPMSGITQDLLLNGYMFRAAGTNGLEMSVGESLQHHLRQLSQAIVNRLSES